MYCQHCGEEVEDTAKFCSTCGQNLPSPPLQVTEREGDSDDAKIEPAESTADQTGSQWELSHERRNGEQILSSFKANRTQSEGRAVGGKLYLTNQRLLFEPGSVDSQTGGEKVSIELDAVEKVSKESRGGHGLKDTFFGGGLRSRLRIDRNDEATELFVVGNLSEVIDKINSVIGSGPVESKESEEKWNPRYPITSVFSAVMLLWAWTAYEDPLFLIAAIPILPRVRRYFVPWIRDTVGLDLTERTPMGVVGVVYVILVGIAALLMGGYAGRDPSIANQPLNWLGVWLGMILIAFVIAVAMVITVRVVGRLL